MARLHVKKNDIVTVISGASKGKSGKVLAVTPDKQQVVVEGLNLRRKAVRRSPENPQGGFNELEAPIHASNVMLQEKYDERRKKQGKAPAVAEASTPAQTQEQADTQDEVSES